MDENKLQRLREIGYRFSPSCSMCVNGKFLPGMPFGSCSRWQYDHRKHSGPSRELSVHYSGLCEEFKWRPSTLEKLPPEWREFLVMKIDHLCKSPTKSSG